MVEIAKTEFPFGDPEKKGGSGAARDPAMARHMRRIHKMRGTPPTDLLMETACHIADEGEDAARAAIVRKLVFAAERYALVKKAESTD